MRGSSDLQLLAQLQHHGAATGLIDFTLDPLVALWFACDPEQEADGAVYVLSSSNVEEIDDVEMLRSGWLNYFYRATMLESTPFVWRVSEELHGRPATQQSAFVLGVPLLRPASLRRIVISKDAKRGLLEELRRDHGVAEETLFDDFPGYSKSNAVASAFDLNRIVRFWSKRAESANDTPAEEYEQLNCGLARAAINDFQGAREWFSSVLRGNPTFAEAYANRAMAHHELEDFERAIEDYTTAIEIWNTDESNETARASAHWWRSLVYKALEDEARYLEDFNRAISLGLRVYCLENGTLSFRPPGDDEYRD